MTTYLKKIFKLGQEHKCLIQNLQYNENTTKYLHNFMYYTHIGLTQYNSHDTADSSKEFRNIAIIKLVYHKFTLLKHISTLDMKNKLLITAVITIYTFYDNTSLYLIRIEYHISHKFSSKRTVFTRLLFIDSKLLCGVTMTVNI